MSRQDDRSDTAREETLDPDDWSETRDVAHRAVDDAVAYLRDVRERPIWKDMPSSIRALFDAPAPRRPRSPSPR